VPLNILWRKASSLYLQKEISSPQEILSPPCEEPDADALGSSSWMANYPHQERPCVFRCHSVRIPSFLNGLKGMNPWIDFSNPDHVDSSQWKEVGRGRKVSFALDSRFESRFNELGELDQSSGCFRCEYDHHQILRGFCRISESWSTKQRATCELVYWNDFVDLGDKDLIDKGESLLSGLSTQLLWLILEGFRHPNYDKKRTSCSCQNYGN